MQDTIETTIAEFERIPTGIEGSLPEDDMIISSSALSMISQIRQSNELTDEFFLRIATRSGGCSGLSYSLGFDSQIEDSDRVYDTDKIKLVIDATSLFYLMGVTLDYVDGPHGSGFVFNNPNNAPTCGCHG